MPLFHVHGIVAGVLAPLAAGSCVACAGDFSAASFYACVDEVQPTWYTAVPAIHQAILAHAPRADAIVARQPPALRALVLGAAAPPGHRASSRRFRRRRSSRPTG